MTSAVSLRIQVVLLCTVLAVFLPGFASASPRPSDPGLSGGGQVVVSGKDLMRDGRPWTPHGYYQIAFEVAPANFGRADHPFWANAYQHYAPAEYGEMRAAGADSVRVQIAQVGADPRSALFDRAWLEKALGAVRAARQAGLTVIVAVQDETHVKGETPIDLPDEGTQRVWQEIAPRFAGDHGVLYELLNEPRPLPSPATWQRWADTMKTTIRTVRAAGATNVVVADGLATGHVVDGAPPLGDGQVAYASHPYALPAPTTRAPLPWEGPDRQDAKAWDAQFGRLARHAPVIITEWGSGGYYCDQDTPASTVAFMRYLDEHHVGLEAGTWDWASGGFGSVRWNFPSGADSSFRGLACHQKGYGAGASVRTWYRTGTPPARPE